MIPEAAVEAAKKVAYERYGSKPDAAYLQTILKAAAPHIRAQALEDAAAIAGRPENRWWAEGKNRAKWLRNLAVAERPIP